MLRKRSFRILMSLALLAAGAILATWFSGHRPIARHNDSLQAAIGQASRVEITVTPRLAQDGYLLPAKPPVVITDRTEIDRMLTQFKLPWHLRATGLFHECGGHLRLRIVMPDSNAHALQSRP